MRRLRYFFLAVLGLSAAAAQQSAILFEGARLIIGDGSAPIENSAFIIENNKIRNIYSAMFYPPPEMAVPNWPPYEGNWPLPPAPGRRVSGFS